MVCKGLGRTCSLSGRLAGAPRRHPCPLPLARLPACLPRRRLRTWEGPGSASHPLPSGPFPPLSHLNKKFWGNWVSPHLQSGCQSECRSPPGPAWGALGRACACARPIKMTLESQVPLALLVSFTTLIFRMTSSFQAPLDWYRPYTGRRPKCCFQNWGLEFRPGCSADRRQGSGDGGCTRAQRACPRVLPRAAGAVQLALHWTREGSRLGHGVTAGSLTPHRRVWSRFPGRWYLS